MTRYVDLDFETRSMANLKLVGSDVYAQDISTEILCLVFDGKQWMPGFSDWSEAPEQLLRAYAANPEVIFVAHNAGFEQAIWRHIMVPKFGFPEIPIERWEDTMATCAWKAVPLALDKAGWALRVPIEKDREGNRLTLSMSKVDKKTGMLPEVTPEKLERIVDYCTKDVQVETAIRHRIGLLSEQSPYERGIWCLDQRINQRGVRIDLDFVRAAREVVDRATVPLLVEFRDLTGGLNPGQRDKIIAWAADQGVELENLQKGYLDKLLDAEDEVDDVGYVSNAEEDDGGDNSSLQAAQPLPNTVRRMLEIRTMLGSASIKKLARMQACVGPDGRARNLLQYHAAGPGRWGGRLLQPQNFPRGSLKVSPQEAVDAIMTGDPEYVEMVLGAPAIECVASSLRHALIADPGKRFLVGDFAGIEMRVDLALAGQHDKCRLLAQGADVYLDMACDIYNVPRGSLTKADVEKRQIGKNTVLGCGFQMGATKFHDRYCPDQPYEFAERVVRAYRQEWAPKVPDLWTGLETAALEAMFQGVGEAYGVTYRHEGEWLTASLPSGWQKLWYHRPVLFHDEMFNKDAWSYRKNSGIVSQVKAYGGLLTENAVQALARGLLVASMMRLEKAGYHIVLTVHDEIMCEVDGHADLATFKQLMATPTDWARRIGIPIAVEAWEGTRYRK